MKLDYIVLPSENIMELQEWYSENLGLGIKWESKDFVLLTGDNGDRLDIYSGSPLIDPGLVNLHFNVDNIDQTYHDLRDVDVEFVSPPEDTDWGYRTAVTRDPAGNTVEFFTRTNS